MCPIRTTTQPVGGQDVAHYADEATGPHLALRVHRALIYDGPGGSNHIKMMTPKINKAPAVAVAGRRSSMPFRSASLSLSLLPSFLFCFVFFWGGGIVLLLFSFAGCVPRHLREFLFFFLRLPCLITKNRMSQSRKCR